MNIEFLLHGTFDTKRVLPIRDRLFKSIVSSLNEVNINPLVILSEYFIMESENTLIYSFHPSSDPLYIEYKNNTITATVSTGAFGAGYHRFIIGVLDRIARRLDIVFYEDENHKDPSGYYKERDFEKLQNFFINSLSNYSEMLLTHHNSGFSNFMISMPYDYPMIENEYFALSCLGYWGKSVFNDFIHSDFEDKKLFANEFFVWHNEDLNAKFWFKSLMSLIWLYFPFREYIDDNEKTLYRKILYSFEEAYKKDHTLNYPWDILVKIAIYLDDENLAKFINSKKNSIHNNINIGFRTDKARYSIAGGFNIVLPMRMNMNRSDKTLVEFRDIHIYIAMQVYTFANEEKSIIMEYVLKQIDLVDEEKGEKIDIKLPNNKIDCLAYEKKLDENDYMITVATVTNKLAMLSWFTYNGLENKEICIEAIKSISLDD